MVSEVSGVIRPQFLEKLSKAHHARLARCVIMTGNIHDLFLFQEKDVPEPEFLTVEDLLYRTLSHAHYPRVEQDDRFMILALKSDGFHFVNPEDKKELVGLAGELSSPTKWIKLKEKVSQDKDTQKASQELGTALKQVLGELSKEDISALAAVQVIGRLLRSVAKARKLLEGEEVEGKEYYVRPICIVIDQAETTFPNVEVARMSPAQSDVWRHFNDLLRDENIWADGASADKRPDFIVLLSPTVSEINSKILTLPKTDTIAIPLPDEQASILFATRMTERFPVPSFYEGSINPVQDLVRDGRGLTLRAFDDLIVAAYRDPEGSPLNRRTVTAEVNKRLSVQLGDIVKMVRPEHSMQEDVVGFRELKARLRYLGQRIDHPKRAPAGMTVVGPNGAGKTFIIEAWGKDIGREVMTLGQIRNEYFGKTEVFVETFESVLSVYGRSIVLIDEAHKAFGSLHDKRTYATEAYLTRHIIQMISNSKYRGKIFWVLVTTRPDMLDPDFVRSGRCSLFVPIFDPEGEDANDFFDWMMRNFEGEGITLSEEEKELLKKKSQEKDREFSAGDYRKFMDDFIAEKDFRKTIFGEDVKLADYLERWVPSSVTIGLEREYQLYLAALRCEWPELLPERFKGMSHDEIQKKIDELKERIDFGT